MREMWLVQTGSFRKNIEKMESVDDIVELRYMGAAEFEGTFTYVNGKSELVNPLWLSLRRMIRDREEFEFVKMLKRKNALSEQMYIYCRSENVENTKAAVRKFLKGEPCKISTGITRYLDATWEDLAEDKELDRRHYRDFYWDIENDVFIFWGEENMEKIKTVLEYKYNEWKTDLFPEVKKSVFEKIMALLKKKSKMSA